MSIWDIVVVWFAWSVLAPALFFIFVAIVVIVISIWLGRHKP